MLNPQELPTDQIKNSSPNQVEATKQRQRRPGGGRKAKSESQLYKHVSIRLHPQVVEWAKAEAERRGIGYQSLINEILLQQMN